MPKSVRLLIIEDVEDHALLLIRELTKGGFEPDFLRVESLQELEEALDTGRWDAIISDFNLPGFDGIDALNMVQEKKLDLPFLLVSGAIGEEKAAEVMKAGAHDYIRKGNYARLVPTLERELREAKVRYERRLTAEELTRHREHLEELVAERTEELVKVNEALEAEKKEREQVLAQLEAVLESIKEGVIISDLQGNILMMNREAMAMLRYQTMEEVRRPAAEYAETFELFYLNGAPVPFEEWPLFRALARERFSDYELMMRRRDTGEAVFVSYTGTCVYDKAGEAILAVVTIHDITERKRAEEALRKSEYKFSKIFHSAPTLIGITTMQEGRIVDINENALQTMGYSKEEVLGRTMAELDVWENEEDLANVMRLIADEGSVRNCEMRFRGKNGQIFTGLFSADVITLDKEQYMLCLVRDITERKRVEQALVRAKEEWERTFNSVPDLIAIIDEEFRIVRVNRAMADRLHRQPEECVGLPCHTALHGSDVPPDLCPHRSLDLGKPQDSELFGDHLGGHFLVSTTPLTGPDGKVIGAVHVARDISERKRAEEEIERLNADLAARIGELEETNQELEAFNRIVSHDLRQPLNTVGLSCQELKLLCGDDLSESCLKPLQTAFGAVQRMDGLIEGLLKLSRSTHEHLRLEEVNLSEIARSVMEELRLAEPNRMVHYRAADGVTVNGDPVLLRSVLENLLGNASKYTAMREEAVIEFGASMVDGEKTCFVRDNGIGFDMADAEKIFAPFQRLDSVREYAGFGIGLATVQRIIRRHGGRIWAEGEPGKGATFYFTLSSQRSTD